MHAFGKEISYEIFVNVFLVEDCRHIQVPDIATEYNISHEFIHIAWILFILLWLGTDRLSGIILCMRSAKEKQRYIVISSLIGGDHTQNDPWILPIPCRIISVPPMIVRVLLKLYLRIWATSCGSNKK